MLIEPDASGPRPRVTTRTSLLFHRLASYYDALVGDKDYRLEADYLRSVAGRYGRDDAATWLDVGCGTGRHLERLRRTYGVTGVDVSSAMLRLARRRLPGVRLVLGDMRTFRLDDRFDVVSCLFSAIGHLPAERAVRIAFANFARHLRPGGVALVEPWLDPAEFRSGSVYLATHRDRGTTTVRLSRSSRVGNRSKVRYHYLVAEPGRPIRHWEESVDGLLVPRRRLLELLAAAGLRARFLPPGPGSGRGLLVGTKPRSPPGSLRARGGPSTARAGDDGRGQIRTGDLHHVRVTS